jgi:hypothetical protein
MIVPFVLIGLIVISNFLCVYSVVCLVSTRKAHINKSELVLHSDNHSIRISFKVGTSGVSE